jgi:GMP synthase-like glutamine amidotransferase
VALMRRFGDADKSVLGVCLGSQLLARAYGADNLIGKAPEFGWCTVALTKDGEGDPVLSAAAGSFPIFQWHSDTFTLPEGAVRLATNGAAENQAFRIGRAVYGTQFHFEANQPVVDAWVEAYPDVVERNAPGWLARRDTLAAQHAPAADATGLALARAWVATIAASEACRVA